MIIYRQRIFANKANKEMVRDWKLRERIKESGIVDKINAERESQVRELTKGQTPKNGFLGIGGQDVPHATKLTEEEIFQQAKGGRRALQEKIQFDKGLTNSASRFVGENPELFREVNKNSAARGLGRGPGKVEFHYGRPDDLINNKVGVPGTGRGSFSPYVDREFHSGRLKGRKTSAGRAREIGMANRYGAQTYHMSGAEYHAKKAAEKKAAEEAARIAAENRAKAVKESIAKHEVKAAELRAKKELGKKLKTGGKVALGVGTAAGLAYGGKKLYDRYNKKKENENN